MFYIYIIVSKLTQIKYNYKILKYIFNKLQFTLHIDNLYSFRTMSKSYIFISLALKYSYSYNILGISEYGY